MDPFALLGVSPDASPEELARAYRALAKEWHPDHQATSEAAFRMAQINAAYEAAREQLADATDGRGAAADEPPSAGAHPRPVARSGAWLEPRFRRALGPELLRALHDREGVQLVVATSMWASPHARLAVTDHRLLWLLEDAIGDRVRSLRFAAIADVDHRLAWPRRRTATVRLRTHHGRRLRFADLSPATAAEVVGHLRGQIAA